mgnify:CR=1 FL=1
MKRSRGPADTTGLSRDFPSLLLDDLVRRDGRVARLQTHPALPVGGERTKRAALGRDASPVLRAQSVQRRRPIEQRREIEIRILLEQRHAEPARDAHDHPAAGIGQRQRNRLAVQREAVHAAGHAVSRQHRGARPREVIPKQIHHDDLIEPHARPSSEHADLLQWPDPGRADRGDRVLPCGPGPGIAGDGKRGGSRTFRARQIRPKLERVSRVLQRHRLSLQQIELPARIRAEPRIVMVKRLFQVAGRQDPQAAAPRPAEAPGGRRGAAAPDREESGPIRARLDRRKLAAVGVVRHAVRGSLQRYDRTLDGLPRVTIDDTAGHADRRYQTTCGKDGERRDRDRRAQQSVPAAAGHEIDHIPPVHPGRVVIRSPSSCPSRRSGSPSSAPASAASPPRVALRQAGFDVRRLRAGAGAHRSRRRDQHGAQRGARCSIASAWATGSTARPCGPPARTSGAGRTAARCSARRSTRAAKSSTARRI